VERRGIRTQTTQSTIEIYAGNKTSVKEEKMLNRARRSLLEGGEDREKEAIERRRKRFEKSA